ncbi:LysR family transcriptional regulator [Novosphingobium flavum]|uniref:LysR family transcriptional regulator n=2 Tax=Novosphingobium flavum TaxID=1778672 RepID=A0A7X1FNT6_9SPHN|nr:LysR family transcriptional regulator [Novosphingobium flavum]
MTPLGLEVRHIEILEAVLAERHISRAAERLALSQPAVSNVMGQLRRHFSDDLLIRHGGQMVLTPFAHSLKEQVAATLKGIRALAKARPHFDPAANDRSFTLAMPPHVGAMVMPNLIQAIALVAPQVRLECVPLGSSWEQFGAGDIDIVLSNVNLLPPMTPNIIVFEDHWRCLVSAQQHFAGDTITRDELARLRFVEPLKEQRLAMPPMDLEAPHSAAVPMEIIPHIVAAGGGVSIVPASFAQFHQLSLPLRSCPLPFETPIIQCAMAWPFSQDHDPANIWLRDRVFAAAEPVSLRLAALEGGKGA